MEIRQIRNGIDNFSYLIYCEKTGKAALVDPGFNASECMKEIGRLRLDILWIINTHFHSDHTRENQRLVDIFKCGLVAHKLDAKRIPGVTKTVEDGEIIVLGIVELKFIHTPGHTPGGICILADDSVLLTGDTLFIGDCGRTDIDGGSNIELFNSLQKLKSLPDTLVVYPGHDYGPKTFDTLGSQKQTNKTILAKSIDEFSRIL